MLELDALEHASTILREARYAVIANDTLWTLLFHADRYIQSDFKAVFDKYFGNPVAEDDLSTH